MTGRRISIKGFKIKDGTLLRDEKQYDVSTRIKRRRGSKKVRVKRNKGIGFL